MRHLFVAVAIVVALAPAAAAGPEDVASDISAEIISPFCEGVTLHDCPSAAAVDLRNEIEEWARAGWTRDRILDRLEDQFGPGIHAAPPADGFGLVAWLLPAAALLLGIGLAAVVVRRWTRRRDAGPPAPTATSEEKLRLEAELRALKRAEGGTV